MATEEEKKRRAKENRRRQQDKALDYLEKDRKGPQSSALSTKSGSMKDRLDRGKSRDIARQKIIAEAIRKGDREWAEDDRYKY